jgi:hypothetical protein
MNLKRHDTCYSHAQHRTSTTPATPSISPHSPFPISPIFQLFNYIFHAFSNFTPLPLSEPFPFFTLFLSRFETVGTKKGTQGRRDHTAVPLRIRATQLFRVNSWPRLSRSELSWPSSAAPGTGLRQSESSTRSSHSLAPSKTSGPYTRTSLDSKSPLILSSNFHD